VLIVRAAVTDQFQTGVRRETRSLAWVLRCNIAGHVENER